jgi:hypothetical protein
MAQAQPADSGVWVEIEFLDKHEAHLRYDWFGYRGRPLGSGAVESAIRRVINLRLKGNGIYRKEENAEAMLVLRAAVLTGRWQETMEKVQVAMAGDRRRDWQWGAPAGRTHVFRKSLSCKDLQSSARNSTSRKFFADKDL